MGLSTIFANLKQLPRTLTKFIWYTALIAFATLYLYNQAAPVPQQAKMRPVFCVYTYEVTAKKVPVCSTEELSDAELKVIQERLVTSLKLYRSFAKARLGNVTYNIPLRIYVMDVNLLNDRQIFGNQFKGRVVGRYTSQAGHVYVTTEIFQKMGETDLQHELAHYGNDNLGISQLPIDEHLATKFEDYYRHHVE
jgi:hypothetical protein